MSANVKAFFYSSSPAKQIFALPVTSQWGNGRVCLERGSIGSRRRKPATKRNEERLGAPRFKRNSKRKTLPSIAFDPALAPASGTGDWLPVRLPAAFQSFSGKLAQAPESKSNGASERHETFGDNSQHSLAARIYPSKILASCVAKILSRL